MPSLILITGWAHAANSLSSVAEHLSNRFSVHLVPPHELQGPDYAQALVEQLARHPQPVVVAGWSMGGMIALQAAGHRPDLISGLILISSTARFCSDTGYPCGIEPQGLASMRAGIGRAPHRVLSRFFEQACRPQPMDSKKRDAFIADAMNVEIPELTRGLDYLASTDLRPTLCRLECPVLLLHGKADAIIPSSASTYLANNLPSARLLLSNKTGHDLPMRKPGFTAEAIRDFAQQVSI